jgi:hypothetical protein
MIGESKGNSTCDSGEKFILDTLFFELGFQFFEIYCTALSTPGSAGRIGAETAEDQATDIEHRCEKNQAYKDGLEHVSKLSIPF